MTWNTSKALSCDFSEQTFRSYGSAVRSPLITAKTCSLHPYLWSLPSFTFRACKYSTPMSSRVNFVSVVSLLLVKMNILHIWKAEWVKETWKGFPCVLSHSSSWSRQSQESKTKPTCPTWVTGAQMLYPSFTIFHMHQWQTDLETKQLWFEVVLCYRTPLL